MYCMYCGKEINNNASYCSFCGQKIAINNATQDNNIRNTSEKDMLISLKCPDCGASLKRKKNDRYIDCDYCGYTIFFDDGVKRSESKHYRYVRNITEEMKLEERKARNRRKHEEIMAEIEDRKRERRAKFIGILALIIVAVIVLTILISKIKENWETVEYWVIVGGIFLVCIIDSIIKRRKDK